MQTMIRIVGAGITRPEIWRVVDNRPLSYLNSRCLLLLLSCCIQIREGIKTCQN